MHIASGLTLVRRNPAQSNVANAGITRPGRLARLWPPEQSKLRKILPGAILLATLVLLGAVFPMLF